METWVPPGKVATWQTSASGPCTTWDIGSSKSRRRYWPRLNTIQFMYVIRRSLIIVTSNRRVPPIHIRVQLSHPSPEVFSHEAVDGLVHKPQTRLERNGCYGHALKTCVRLRVLPRSDLLIHASGDCPWPLVFQQMAAHIVALSLLMPATFH